LLKGLLGPIVFCFVHGDFATTLNSEPIDTHGKYDHPITHMSVLMID